jgi:hypothetical protein
VHSRSVAEGVIPVCIPPPWGENATPTNIPVDLPSSTKITPAPPPFGAKTTTNKVTKPPGPKVMPADQLQDLSPSQLESLIPWSTLVKDMQAECTQVRAAVRAKRIEEGVDVKGRGEAVVAAEAAATVVIEEPDITPTVSQNSVENATAPGRSPPNAPIRDDPASRLGLKPHKPLSNSRPSNAATAPSKGMAQVLARRQALQEKENEAFGKKWPPTRAFHSRPADVPSPSSLPISPVTLRSVSATTALPKRNETDPQHTPQVIVRPSVPIRSASSPAPNVTPRPSPQHLRAYLLWHNQQLPLPQICASMGSGRYPVPKSTVMYVLLSVNLRFQLLTFRSMD